MTRRVSQRGHGTNAGWQCLPLRVLDAPLAKCTAESGAALCLVLGVVDVQVRQQRLRRLARRGARQGGH